MKKLSFLILFTLIFISTTEAQVMVPHKFSAGQPAKAEEVNKNFSFLLKTINEIRNEISPPIGSIIAWHKSFANTPDLPDGWVECNGQTLRDSASPYNGKDIPDLNEEGRFLRGSKKSGTLQDQSMRSHHHSKYTGSGNYGYGLNNPKYNNKTTTQQELGGETRPINMSVVWIMRVK